MVLNKEDSNLVKMYLSLDGNSYNFYVNYFKIISPCDLSNLSIAKMNSVKFSINDPVAKIGSKKFDFFWTYKRENLVCENFCP